MNRKSLIVIAATIPLILSGCDDGSERITELEGQLNTANTKLSEQEAKYWKLTKSAPISTLLMPGSSN